MSYKIRFVKWSVFGRGIFRFLWMVDIVGDGGKRELDLLVIKRIKELFIEWMESFEV